MVLCHINLNLEYAQLHNKTAANNHVLHIVYKTSLFINCIMCLYSGPEAAYYQINQSINHYSIRVFLCFVVSLVVYITAMFSVVAVNVFITCF